MGQILMYPLWALADADWSLHPAARPPLRVEQIHRSWGIMDADDINRARVVNTGAVLFVTEADARAVLERLWPTH